MKFKFVALEARYTQNSECLNVFAPDCRKAIKEEINDTSTYVFSRLQNHKAAIVVKSVH